jgi:hypothetical protein
MNYIDIRFLFCGTAVPTDRALMTDIRIATQSLTIIWLIMITSPLIYIYFTFPEKEYWVIYFCYSLIEMTGPLLVFVGASLLDPNLVYAGYIVFSIFTILEIARIVYIVLIVLQLFPYIDTEYIIAIIGIWVVFTLIRIYINFVFFSCVKLITNSSDAMYLQSVVISKNITVENQQVNRESNQYQQYIPPNKVPDIVSD